jgi:hypothetical protein
MWNSQTIDDDEGFGCASAASGSCRIVQVSAAAGRYRLPGTNIAKGDTPFIFFNTGNKDFFDNA